SAARAAPAAPARLPQASPEALREFDAGMRLLRLGPNNYDRARERLEKAVSLDGSLYEAWHNLGFVHSPQGRFDTAARAFGRALAAQPGARKSLAALGETLRRAGRLGEARDLYEKQLQSQPDDAELRTRLAQVLREAGKLAEALEQVRTVLRQDARNAGA